MNEYREKERIVMNSILSIHKEPTQIYKSKKKAKNEI